MKKLMLVFVIVLSLLPITVFAAIEDLGNPVIASGYDETLPACDNHIVRYNLKNFSDDQDYSYLSQAVFTVPTGLDSCSFYYTLTSSVLDAYKRKVGTPTCSVTEKSVNCYGNIEVGSYVHINTYTKGTIVANPFSIVEDYTNNNAYHVWIFYGIAIFVPTIQT